MQNLYITDAMLKSIAVADEADDSDIWNILAESVSRLFDRQCEVEDGFFNAAGASVSLKSYRANGTRFLKLYPYIPDSITIIDVDGTDFYSATPSLREYHESEGYIKFDQEILVDTPVDVTARYGFSSIPIDVKMACIEQALQMWRRKDLAFTDISGVPAAAITAEFSPTFAATVNRYRGIYSPNQYFS